MCACEPDAEMETNVSYKMLNVQFPLCEDDTLICHHLNVPATLHCVSTLRGAVHCIDASLVLDPRGRAAQILNQDRKYVARVIHCLMRTSIKIGCESRPKYMPLLHFTITLRNIGANLLVEGFQDAAHKIQFRDYVTVPSTVHIKIYPHNIKSHAYGEWRDVVPSVQRPENANDIEWITIDGYPQNPNPRRAVNPQNCEPVEQNPGNSEFESESESEEELVV